MENMRFSILYTLLMVVLHFVLSGGYTTVSGGRKRADSGYWEDNEVEIFKVSTECSNDDR